MINEIIGEAISLDWVQWLAFVFNVIYVVLAVRENIWCWFFGLVGVAFLLVIYLEARLFSDALLQVFYMVMSVYGWINWSRGNQTSTIEIIRAKPGDHLLFIVIGLLSTFVLGYLFQTLQAAVPYIDAFTSAFAVIATFMVARKVLENWIYWIVIDTVCVGVYLSRDLPLLALLFAIYVIFAIIGWVQWKKKLRQKSQ